MIRPGPLGRTGSSTSASPDRSAMLLLEVRPVGGAGPALHLDPEVTVVVGLPADQRRALAELITAAIRGRADLVEGTVVAGGRVLQMAEWAELATSTSAPGGSLDPVAAARRADARVADLRAAVEDARGRAAEAASGQ